LFSIITGDSFGALEGAAYVDRHHPVPFLLADVLERLGAEIRKQAGIVD
jgi:hypothetical protein